MKHPMLPLLRLNPAESVFAPFHDPEMACELPLTLESNTAKGARTVQSWDRLGVHWDAAEAGQPALTARLSGGIQRSHFDHFIFYLVLSKEVDVRFDAIHPDGVCPLTDWQTGLGHRMEITAPLPERELIGINATFRSKTNGPGVAELCWFGLGDSRLVPAVTHYDLPYGEEWEGLLALPSEWPETETFRRELLFGAEDLPALRRKVLRPAWAPLFSLMEDRAKTDLAVAPETWLGAHVPSTDIRYLRTRDVGRPATHNEALVVGFVGLIKRDRVLARQALRHLLTLIHTGDWAVADEMRLQGSTWDERCFHEEMTVTAIALLTDWYAWALTPRAHSLITQILWDKGLSVIERDMMKFEYVYSINQGPWFCRARILGGLLLEKYWPRVGDYVERAKDALLEGLNRYILADGGTDEGVGYFCATLETTLGGLAAYARARGISLRELLPPQLLKSANYVSVLSAVRPGRVLLDGDNSNDETITDAIPMLAAVFPEQAYMQIAAAALPMPADINTYYRQYLGSGVYAVIFGPEELPKPECIVPEFALLPVTGHLTSLRRSGAHVVRLHFAGSKAYASHSHFDKGNVTLEVDGKPLLIDRGTIRYDDARCLLLRESRAHNVLTPVTETGVFLNQSPVIAATIPSGVGDGVQVDAQIDLANVWREHMQHCERRLQSSDPLAFVIEDTGKLNKPSPVAFHLQALEPFQIDGKQASIRLCGITLGIRADWAAAISQSEDLINCHGNPVYHLVILSQPVNEFHLKTQFSICFD